MLEPRKRTALDGKTWWCAFDTDTMKYVYYGKYKTKKECQFAIDYYTKERKKDIKELF